MAGRVELTDQGKSVLDRLWIERTSGLSSRIDRLNGAERDLLETALPLRQKTVPDR